MRGSCFWGVWCCSPPRYPVNSGSKQIGTVRSIMCGARGKWRVWLNRGSDFCLTRQGPKAVSGAGTKQLILRPCASLEIVLAVLHRERTKSVLPWVTPLVSPWHGLDILQCIILRLYKKKNTLVEIKSLWCLGMFHQNRKRCWILRREQWVLSRSGRSTTPP